MTKAFLPYCHAIVTPFTQAGDLDLKSVPGVVKYYLEEVKAPGLLVSGSTGEQHCMSVSERKQLYQAVADAVPKDFTLYAGVAAFKTHDAIELAQAAESSGYAGIMLGVPPYRTPLQRELSNYVIAVADAIKIPIFVYNNPARNGCQIEPETYVHMVKSAKNKNIKGIKETGDDANVKKVKSLLGESLDQEQTYFTGFDDKYIECITQYAFNGLTTVYGGVFPQEVAKIVDYVTQGQVDQAKQVFSTLENKYKLLVEIGDLQAIKFILRERGVPAGFCPPPLMDPTDEQKKLLKAFV
jgi:4-hydroxy-tetrahydrodipicolinate synthase